jgi:hypothetical protein
MTTLLRAEFRKLRFTRSLWAIPAVGAFVSMAGSVLFVAFAEEPDIARRLSEHNALRFGPTNVGLILLVFGIRLFADETHHHTLASTYVAAPHRRRVLAAKAAVAAIVAFAFSVAVFAVVIPTTLIGVNSRDLPMAIDVAATAGLLLRTTVAMILVTVLGTTLAAIIRNRAVVLVACLVWLAFAENLVGALFKIPEMLPGAVIRALVAGTGGPDALNAPAAALLMLGLTATAAAAATVRLSHDVA